MITVRHFALSLLLCCMAFRAIRAAEVATLVQKFPAPNATEREALAAEFFKDGEASIQALTKLLVEPGKGDDSKVRFALQAMAIHASRPGADAERKLFAQTAAAELSGGAQPMVKAFLLEQLRLTAGDEQVAPIAALLTDQELSDHALQTLMTIRTASVGAALRAALATAKDGPRATVISALGRLGDKEAAVAILKDAENPDADVRNAALLALAKIGDVSAAPAMLKAAGGDNWSNRNQALQAALTLAQRLVELGKKAEAANVCRSLAKFQIAPKESNLQCAALNILASAEAEAAFEDLKAALKSESNEVRATALSIAAAIPGAAVTQRWAAELKGADSRFACETLGVLERRYDPAGFPAVAEAAKNPDASVRVAALRAAVIGGKDALPILLAVLSTEPTKENEAELAAARLSIVKLKGADINKGMAAALNAAAPTLQKIVIAALADRCALDQVGDVLALTKDADGHIRAAAFEAVGTLGGAKELPTLLNTLVKTEVDDDRANAEKAAAAIASHVSQKASVAGAVVTAMNGASTKARQSLVRVLGKTGGADALAALKPALKDADADVVDSAVRELANWPDIGAQADLLDIAKTTTVLAHNVLALNGYVRLLELESKKPTNDFLPRYKAALELCRRPDEKRKIISGIQNVKTPEGAKVAEELMANESIREEACNAAMNIAKELAKNQKDVARGVFEKVIATTKRADLKKNAQSELDKLGK